MGTFPEIDWVLYRFRAVPKRLKRLVDRKGKGVGSPVTNFGNEQNAENDTQLLSAQPELLSNAEDEAMFELRKAFAHLETQLGITRIDDWYRVSAAEIQKYVRATRRHIEHMGTCSHLNMFDMLINLFILLL